MFRIGLAALILTAGSATAQDLTVYGGGELEFAFDEDGPDTGTNTYLKGYLEVESQGFYAGIWARIANDDASNRADPYLGYRGETAGGLSYDVSYYRYNYVNDTGSNYGELILSLGMPLGDKLWTTLDLAYDPENALGNVYVGAAYTATDKLEISANYGVYEVADAASEQEWDFGGTWSLTDETAVDLRYYDGSEYAGSYIGLSLSWDSTLFTR